MRYFVWHIAIRYRSFIFCTLKGGNMTKAQIAKRVSMAIGMSIPRSLEIVNCVLKSISASVAEGHRVHFRNFGSFYPRKKAERIGRNPKTGEEVAITARTVPCFKASTQLKREVNA